MVKKNGVCLQIWPFSVIVVFTKHLTLLSFESFHIGLVREMFTPRQSTVNNVDLPTSRSRIAKQGWTFVDAINKYADDCTHSECIMKGECSNMQKVLDSVQNWSNANRMRLNAKKTKDMWICFGKSIPQPPNLYIGDVMIERINSFKLLGVSCQSNMKWNSHIKEITRKGNRRLCHLRQCRKAHLPTEVGLGLATYCTKIRPLLEYAAPV